MKAETVHAFALIGLRALAEYDPTEFNRSTDLSKRRLDDRITELITQVKDEAEFDELQRQISQLTSVELDLENQVASTFLLRQISLSCLQRAEGLALGYHRDVGPSDREARPRNWTNAEPVQGIAFSEHNEYLRLGVMRLLRDLPQYNALFDYHWKHHEIDCVLRPLNHEAPTVLVEFKLRLKSVKEVQETFRRLRRAGAGWDKSTLFLILTIGPSHWLSDIKLDGRNFLVIYDPERDEFSYESAARLVQAMRE